MVVEQFGPAELVQAASVARRYYLDGRSKVEIAAEFGLSRFKVARLLEAARASGLVRIEIGHPGLLNVELSGLLQEAFSLKHALVLDAGDRDEAALRHELGRAAAQLLMEIITPTDVLGLAWARSVSAMTTELRRLPPISVVQLTGSLFRTAGKEGGHAEGSIDVVREVARVTRGPAYVFFAPFLVPDAGTARALRRQPDVLGAFAKIGSVTKAVAGIGGWGRGLSTLYEAAGRAERDELTRLGVCADVSGVFLDSSGRPLHTPLNDRIIGFNAAQMDAIEEVIGIPYGTAKAPAVLAALRSGLVNSLVTHASLAKGVLEQE